ncbi:Ankyrin repeat protein 1 [Giardia muris]|uniref:Ankyrin repeat protein 1 n=1 Tax=Giardia muris TaxID=5742 RepID=A0A4Z1SUP1_GIAMU|nr:Ankyrin repeat protein 1 [Giardia muris]|eukprot:TNJ28675.1 Ankyrin repeat protein 1 [Giardia muris]
MLRDDDNFVQTPSDEGEDAVSGPSGQNLNGMTALMHAAENGHTACVELIAWREARQRDENGWTALMHAVKVGRLDCAKLLLCEHGMCTAKGDAELHSNATALMIAAKYGHHECVEILLNLEATKQDTCGWTALMYAIREGHTACVKLLLAHEAGCRNKGGQTGLILATKFRRYSLLPILLETEARLMDDEGFTALMRAAVWGYYECAELLLCEAGLQTTKGVNKLPSGTGALTLAVIHNNSSMVSLLEPYERNLKDKNDHDALWYAQRKGHSKIAEVLEFACQLPLVEPPSIEYCLLKYYASEGCISGVEEHLERAGTPQCYDTTAIMVAAEAGHVDVVRLLIHEARLRDHKGRTALMYAASKGNIACVHELLALELHYTDIQGHTAFSYALLHSHETCALQLSREVTQCDRNGKSPFLRAVQEGQVLSANRVLNNLVPGRISPMQFIASFGDLNSCHPFLVQKLQCLSTAGYTLLMIAAIIGDANMASQCLSLARMQTTVGLTALMFAAMNGNLSLLKLLLPFEAQLRDSNGMTALMHAASLGHKECAWFLKSELAFQDTFGWTALIWAAHCGHHTCVEALIQESQLTTNLGENAMDIASRGQNDTQKRCYETIKRYMSILSDSQLVL